MKVKLTEKLPINDILQSSCCEYNHCTQVATIAYELELIDGFPTEIWTCLMHAKKLEAEL